MTSFQPARKRLLVMEVSKFQLKWELRMRLSDLFLKDVMSDVTFVVDDPPQRCPCHKLILGLGSKVFEAMLYGKMAEKDDIRVPDVTKSGFTILLRYLYTGTISIQNQSDAFEAAYASKKYLIKDLFLACENYLLSNAILNSETVFSLLDETSFLEMKRLQRHCLRYISRNSKAILHSKSFISASKNSFQEMLGLDLMDIESESEIVEALWLWGKEQCQVQGLESSKENVRNMTKDCLQYVRFLSIKHKDLENLLEKFQLLDASDQLTVLWSMAMPKSSETAKLPSNLCDITRTRSINNCSRIQLPTEYRYDGNLSNFSIKDYSVTAEVSVSGPRVTILGVVLAFKPIPCYSSVHRTLDFEMRANNRTTNMQSSAKSFQKAEDEDKREQLEHSVLLEEYIEVSEGESATLTVRMVGEGIRLMQCLQKEFSCECGDASVSFRFSSDSGDKVLFPVKEIMCVST